jgi:hypothetical protein
LFRIPPEISENVPKAGYECKLRKMTNESTGKPEQKFDAAFRITVVSLFKEASKNFILIFL